MGIVASARVSYAGGASKGEEKDRKLITYLLKHDHTSPFEQAVFKFHVKCPIFVARQWFRHRIASYNEISYRYTEVKDEFYIPTAWRAQDIKNKQGSVSTPKLDHAALTAVYQSQIDSSKEAYNKLLAAGVAREMARMVLPVGLYTEFYWTINARSLMNFIQLRADVHAQWEIQQFAEALADVFAEKMPWAWAAFLAHVWKGQNPKFDAAKPAEAPAR